MTVGPGPPAAAFTDRLTPETTGPVGMSSGNLINQLVTNVFRISG